MEFTLNGINISKQAETINGAAQSVSNTAQGISNTSDFAEKAAKAGANKIVGVIFLIIGIIFGGIGFLMFNSQNSKLEQYTASVEADKIEIGRHKDSDGDTQYTPTYYYKVNGTQYKCKSSSSSSSKPSESQATVKYDPSDPTKCLSEYDQESTGMIAIIFMVMGAVMAVMGIIFAIVIKNKMQAAGVANPSNPNEPTPIR